MTQEHYDVAIIGAGPSGCAAALTLRKSGLRVVLIDKSSFPRDKVCGDAIPIKAFNGMDYIDEQWGLKLRNMQLGSKVISAALFTPKSSKIIRTWSAQALNVRRVDFDDFLLNLVKSETDTIVLENKRLKNISVNKHYAECILSDDFKFRANIILGCDGANSVVVRNLASFELRGKHVITAVRAYVNGISDLEEGVNEVHLFKEFPTGYFWIFPLTNGWANVGFGHFSEKNDHLNQRAIMQQIIDESPNIKKRFTNAIFQDGIKGFALPLGTEKKKISGERFMLCGDAATLIDPVGGNGIDNAIWSGIYAAEQTINCYRHGNFSSTFMKAYDKRIYQTLGPDLSRNTKIMRLVNRFPWLLNYVEFEFIIEYIKKFIRKFSKTSL